MNFITHIMLSNFITGLMSAMALLVRYLEHLCCDEPLRWAKPFLNYTTQKIRCFHKSYFPLAMVWIRNRPQKLTCYRLVYKLGGIRSG